MKEQEAARATALIPSSGDLPKSGGVGYSSKRYPQDKTTTTPEIVKTFKAVGETALDEYVAGVIGQILRDVAPGPRDTTIFDTLIVTMLHHSRLLETVVGLIRNDSVDNITERHAIYEIVFQLLYRLASQGILCKSLINPRPDMTGSPGIWELDYMFAVSEDNKILPSVVQTLENTYKQALTFIELANKHSGVGSK